MQRQPFALAYAVLREQLRQADRWLIAGYSFRDACVNTMLREEFRRKRRAPHIMVVTCDDAPTDWEVLGALGWSPFELGDPHSKDFLYISRDGIQGAPASAEWTSWKGFGSPPLSATA